MDTETMSEERRIPVTRTVIVRLYCQCGGEMLPTGYVLTTHPPYYPHRCQQCGAESIYETRSYPYVGYEVEQQQPDAHGAGGSDPPGG